jgi:hypothetical protein
MDIYGFLKPLSAFPKHTAFGGCERFMKRSPFHETLTVS